MKLLKDLQKYFENLKTAKPTTPACRVVLGAGNKVDEFADFFQRNAAELQMLVAYKLMNYAQSQDFTQLEYMAFRDGLAELPTFMDACFKEVQARKQNKLDDI